MNLDKNPKIKPPSGGRVVAIDGLIIDRRKTWPEAINSAVTHEGLNADEMEQQRKVLRCGNQFSRPGAGLSLFNKTTYLVNFGPEPSFSSVIGWVKANNCKFRSPRVVFAIAENWGNLDLELGVANLCLLSDICCFWGESVPHWVCVKWLEGLRFVELRDERVFSNKEVWLVCTAREKEKKG